MVSVTSTGAFGTVCVREAESGRDGTDVRTSDVRIHGGIAAESGSVAHADTIAAPSTQ